MWIRGECNAIGARLRLRLRATDPRQLAGQPYRVALLREVSGAQVGQGQPDGAIITYSAVLLYGESVFYVVLNDPCYVLHACEKCQWAVATLSFRVITSR